MDITTLQADLLKCRAQLRDAERELNQLRRAERSASDHSGEIDSLRAQNQALQQQLEDMQTQPEVAEPDIAEPIDTELLARLEAQDAQITELTEQNAELKEQLDQKVAELKKSDVSADRLRQDIQTLERKADQQQLAHVEFGKLQAQIKLIRSLLLPNQPGT